MNARLVWIQALTPHENSATGHHTVQPVPNSRAYRRYIRSTPTSRSCILMSRGQDQELAGEADLYLTGQVEVVLLPPVGACCGYQLLYNVAG
ncbi:hypothetical protein ABBQ32_006323 [Trebouxia sp. C0010 RCD-2024]